VCAQQQQTCGVDLNPYAATGEEAVVLVKGATGTFVASNSGGSSVATVSQAVYSNSGNAVEYAVTYATATSSATTDTLMIHDYGSNTALTIPVTIMSPGDDAGASFFALQTTSGTVCPGNQVTFDVKTQGNATVVLSSSDPTLITIAQNRSVYLLNMLRAGSGYVTATAGSSTVIYPANVPATGFTPSC
jgi:hypothetical protein